MDDQFSSGLTLVVLGALGIWWFARIIAKDFKKKELIARNIFMFLAMLSSLVFVVLGVLKML